LANGATVACWNNNWHKWLNCFLNAAIFSIDIGITRLTLISGVLCLYDDRLPHQVILLLALRTADLYFTSREGFDPVNAWSWFYSLTGYTIVIAYRYGLFKSVVRGKGLLNLIEFLSKCRHLIGIVIFKCYEEFRRLNLFMKTIECLFK
jgi:hypothetical protein